MGTRIKRVPPGWVPPVKEIKEEPAPQPVKEKKPRKKGVKKNESDS